MLHVLPLGSGEARQLLPGAAAIFVAGATTPRPAPIEAIAGLFDLTPAEARVLDQLAAGRTNAAAAEALDIGVSTVRTHLQRLFDKTRTRRQSDLVALAAAFSLPLGVAPWPSNFDELPPFGGRLVARTVANWRRSLLSRSLESPACTLRKSMTPPARRRISSTIPASRIRCRPGCTIW